MSKINVVVIVDTKNQQKQGLYEYLIFEDLT